MIKNNSYKRKIDNFNVTKYYIKNNKIKEIKLYKFLNDFNKKVKKGNVCGLPFFEVDAKTVFTICKQGKKNIIISKHTFNTKKDAVKDYYVSIFNKYFLSRFVLTGFYDIDIFFNSPVEAYLIRECAIKENLSIAICFFEKERRVINELFCDSKN